MVKVFQFYMKVQVSILSLGTDSIDVTYDDVEKLLYVPVSSDIQFNFGTNADIVQFSVTLQFRLKLLKMDRQF